jgi:hypothetical protein
VNTYISWALWSRLSIKGCSLFRGGTPLSPHGFGHKFSSNMGDCYNWLYRDIQSYSLRLLFKLGIGLEHNGLEMRLIGWKCDLLSLTHLSPELIHNYITHWPTPRNYFKTLPHLPIQPAHPTL